MLNIVLGAGLLTLPGLAVWEAGENALTVWLACVVTSIPLLAALALIGRRYPNAGGLARVAHIAFGSFGYAVTTLLFLGAVLFGLPSIALTGGYYAAVAFGGSAHVFALGFILFAVAVNLVSVEWTSRINTAIAGLVVLALLATAIIGMILTAPNWPAVVPPMPPTLSPEAFGLTFMMVFFAFTGWEVAANLSAEFHKPSRDFPIAMGLSFLIAVVLYLALALVAGSLDLANNAEAPFVALFDQHFGRTGGVVIALVAVTLISANLSAAVWAVSRMVWSAATEGLLPTPLASVGENGTPFHAVFATVATLVFVVILSAFGVVDLSEMLAMAGQNFLMIYAIVAGALILLGYGLWDRSLAAVCVFIVAVLVVLRGADGLLYPAFLALIAVLPVWRRRVKSVLPQTE